MGVPGSIPGSCDFDRDSALRVGFRLSGLRLTTPSPDGLGRLFDRKGMSTLLFSPSAFSFSGICTVPPWLAVSLPVPVYYSPFSGPLAFGDASFDVGEAIPAVGASLLRCCSVSPWLVAGWSVPVCSFPSSGSLTFGDAGLDVGEAIPAVGASLLRRCSVSPWLVVSWSVPVCSFPSSGSLAFGDAGLYVGEAIPLLLPVADWVRPPCQRWCRNRSSCRKMAPSFRAWSVLVLRLELQSSSPV